MYIYIVYYVQMLGDLNKSVKTNASYAKEH